jgi:hypothetical protein
MKKILKIFLISLAILTFSNTASAGFFGDIFKDIFGKNDESFFGENHGDVNSIRCKVEYTQLDLTTGIEKTVKHTIQHETKFVADIENTCYLSTQYATDKINNWLNKSPNNIIVNLSVINCKSRRIYSNKTRLSKVIESRWDKYKSCDDEFNANLIDWLDRPKQQGFNVHKERLIRDYEEGFENFYGEEDFK